jgi:radical SAM superfamily enzyme YgiQ (UPF0313 family)
VIETLFINPPREIPQWPDFPPLGLSYICSSLKKNGITASVLDASSFSWRQLKNVVKEKSPLVVGIPCWTLERGQSFKVAKVVKEVLPHVKIIMGGYHATAFPEHMFRLASADVIVTGEGEITSVELVKTLLDNGDVRGIKGIAYRENGEVIITEPRDFIENLDSIPFPAYDDFDLDKYLGLPGIKGRAAAIITSRGCPYQCIFCSSAKFWKRKWRGRTAENVLGEIEWLYGNFKIRTFMFFDDNFTIKKKRAVEICQGILERNLNISWVCCSHVTQIDKELLNWMARAGCFRIDYGVESGSPEILKNIKKGQTVEQIEETFKLTHEAGIKPRAYLMVGNPGETESTIKQTIELTRKIKPYDTTSAQLLWLLPDTEIYELSKSQNIICDDYWLGCNSMVYYTSEHTVKELKALREQLMKGLVKNQRNVKAYGEYIIRKVYYRYPISQKLRKIAINLRKSRENITH